MALCDLGQDVQIDKILSEFVSTSAHHHNKACLNHMQGFIEAKKHLACIHAPCEWET